MLEHSVQKEVQRLCNVVGSTEIQEIEKNEIQHEVEEVTEGGGEIEIVRRLQQQLKTALDHTQMAMHESWSGHLVSQIVGTLTTTTTLSISTTCTNADDDSSMAHDNTTTTTTTTVVQQRIKKNGNIQRPLPIPLPLPVIFANRKNECNNDDKSMHQMRPAISII